MTTNKTAHFSEIELKLPVAPQANHRLVSAPEEKPPAAMLPKEALAWIAALQKNGRTIKAVELAGPGDPLADASAAFTTLELIGPQVKKAEISLTTLGIGAADNAVELVRSGVTKVNVLVDTLNSDTAKKLYAWIRPGRKTMAMDHAAKILLTDQAATVEAMSKAGLTMVIRSRIHADINDNEVGEIAKKMAALGASKMELTAAGKDIPVRQMQSLAAEASVFLETIISLRKEELPPPGTPTAIKTLAIAKPSKDRPNVAVVSSNGMEVDQHLGHAWQVLVYGPRKDGLTSLLETRDTPDTGDAERWHKLADMLSDCFALVATHAGAAPRNVLAESGIQVILAEDNIEGLVEALYGGGKKMPEVALHGLRKPPSRLCRLFSRSVCQLSFV